MSNTVEAKGKTGLLFFFENSCASMLTPAHSRKDEKFFVADAGSLCMPCTAAVALV